MKILFPTVMIIFSTVAWSHSLKLEGNCSGKLDDGSPVALKYYSDFNGCRKISRAALSFEEGLITGRRSLSEKYDIYTFGTHKLVFTNSTGNTSGKYYFKDHSGHRKSVILQCEVRDYEYQEC